MRGYKVFNPDFTCRGVKFSENAEFKIGGTIKICERGFHFCIKASHCFSYYGFDPSNIVCEVEALGKTDTHDEDSKVCTDHIRIGRRLTWDEVLQVANDGKNNTGHSNTGDRNTGYSNTGNSNTGDSNTGYRNTGDRNTGYSNTGNSNTGNRNTGYSNTGYSNTGYSNTGDSNTGYRNTGDRNTGYSNTGNSNTGDSNTGYSNTGDRNTGAFCTGEPAFTLFNKPSTWTAEKFLNSNAWNLMCNYVDTKLWIPASKMNDAEKKAHRGWEPAEGYYKDIPFKEAFGNMWHNLSAENKQSFKDLENYDSEIFEFITGVKY